MAINTTKRVAKNTIIMYLRMIVLIFIAFYSSRLLLSTLGIDDYGVYSVVGSISGSFIALKSLFSESIQRFLNVAKGRNENSLQEQVSIFNTGIIVHIFLLIFFCVLVEIVGSWLLDNRLAIPESRMGAARFVFHMTVLSTAISILSIPYDALVISNEKMGIYALISIIDAFLKLFFIILLPSIGSDYLKTYSILLIVIPLSTLSFQLYYCKKFDECQYRFKIDKILFKDVFNLSGWNFIGNISFSLIHEGINMILNVYGGVVMNAARAVSYQIKNAIGQLSGNAMIALRPKVMQMSVQHVADDYFKIICLISRMSFMTILIVVIPLIVYCNEILHLWLEKIPDNAVLFTRLVLIGLLIRSLHEPINIMNMAVGKIKRMMVIEATIMISFLGIIFAIMSVHGAIWIPFALLSIMEAFIIFFLIINAVKEIGFIGRYYLIHVVCPATFLMIVATLVGYIFYYFIKSDNLIYIILQIVILVLVISLLCLTFMDKIERNIIESIIKRK